MKKGQISDIDKVHRAALIILGAATSLFFFYKILFG
jgi:hypothetical protein